MLNLLYVLLGTTLLALLALLAALCYNGLLKRDMRKLYKEINEIVKNQNETNASVHTDTFDKDIVQLANGINDILTRYREMIIKKNRAEADFKRAITNISHDLRTPLTSVKGYLQMLPGTTDKITQARYLDTVQERLDTLTALMNNLFEFTKLTEGTMVFTSQKVNLCNELRDALSMGYDELAKRNFTVEADIPDTPVFCFCDPEALQRILQNLIKNSWVHGKELLRARVYDNCIEIGNRADGLAELAIEQLFERFYTADASRSGKNTGLGLAIAKELTTQMDGQISAEREGDMLVVRVVFLGAS